MTKNTVLTTHSNQNIQNVIKEMASGQYLIKGLAIVLTENNQVEGIFNDGDLIRLVASGTSLDRPIGEVMTKNPITANVNLSNQEIVDSVRNQLIERKSDVKRLRDIILVDDQNKFVNVVNYLDLISSELTNERTVAIYGQGFVGITLGASLAGIGHQVYGIDTSDQLVQKLKKNIVHVFEPGLNDLVESTQRSGKLEFSTGLENQPVEFYIVAVGTPVNDLGEVNLSALESVCKSIGQRIQPRSVVMLRSTVPVGTTAGVVRSILEKESGMVAGKDFFLAFTPERTAEGKAMQELRELPQVVGGLTPLCTKKACELWATLTDTVIPVDGLEAAELVKLMNNSFRDLSFAFSNSVALLADKYNINSFKLINAANEGYPRNRIPMPSPGVGGYCLTKDPYLFASVDTNLGHAELARTGRKVNDASLSYVSKQVEKYISRNNLNIKDVRVLVVGMAFKGWPETNDLRGSSGVYVANQLRDKGAKVQIWDAVVGQEGLAYLDLPVANYPEDVEGFDMILIMNNHPANIPSGLITRIQNTKKMIFDGWSQLDPKSIENLGNITYSTMGYMSKK